MSPCERFIPSRRNSENINCYDRNLKDKKIDLLSQDTRSDAREVYQDLLRSALGLPLPSDRILGIVGEVNSNSPKKRPDSPYNSPRKDSPLRVKHWPVKPRKQPMLKTPEAVLDLPEFKTLNETNLLDWGPLGLVTTYHGTVFLCRGPNSVTTIANLTIDNTVQKGTALKWDNTGQYLAVGTNMSCIEVWDAVNMKRLWRVWCACIVSECCSIYSFAWHSSGNAVVSGCSNGLISVMKIQDNKLVDRTEVKAHDSAIMMMRQSADGRYLASVDSTGDLMLWMWPYLDAYDHISAVSAKAFAWHPWKSSILAVSQNGNSIAVCNVCSSTWISTYTTDKQAQITAMEWNKLTGEMVVAYRVQRGTTLFEDWKCEIIILDNLNHLVDKIEIPGNSVCASYLLWNSTGNLLATASSDETLRIWSFVQPDEKRKCFPDFNKISLYSVTEFPKNEKVSFTRRLSTIR